MGHPSFDLRLLTSFVAVAEELHFGRAAERLDIAQPALSRQIAKLEEQLGVALLTRSSRDVVLTAAGEFLLTASRDIVARAGRARSAIDEGGRGAEDLTVHIGDGMSPLITRAVSAFGAAHPEVAIRVVQGPMSAATAAVLDHTADAGFDHTPGPPTSLASRVVERRALGLLCADDHALAGAGPLRWTELEGWTLTVPPPGSHDGYKAFLLAAVADQGVSTDLWVSRPPSPDEVQTVIASAGRIVIGPEFLRDVSSVPVTWRPLVPAVTMETVVVWDDGSASDVTRRFVRSVVATAERSSRGVDAVTRPPSIARPSAEPGGVARSRRSSTPATRAEPV